MLEYDPDSSGVFRDPSMFGMGRMTKRFEGLTIVSKPHDNAQFEDIDKVEDANNSAIWGLLADPEENFFDGAEQIDMGKFDEAERQFLIIDKDNSVVYDMRKAKDMERLASTSEVGRTSNLTSQSFSNTTIGKIDQSQTLQARPSQVKPVNPWANFWKEKKQNNQDYLLAAENGDIETLKKMLDPKIMK